jgi:hypothetical protein
MSGGQASAAGVLTGGGDFKRSGYAEQGMTDWR